MYTGGKLHKYKYYINGNGVISPSCGLFCILLLKMLRGCIFTTVGISQMKMQYGSESFCKAFWVWASQLVCSSLVFWDSNAFPWVALTVNSSVSYKCNFLWNAIVWKMLEKHCRGMQLYFSSRGKFGSLYVCIWTESSCIVTLINPCYCKDPHLALIEWRALFNILVRESGYKRNQEVFDKLVLFSYLITYSGRWNDH